MLRRFKILILLLILLAVACIYAFCLNKTALAPEVPVDENTSGKQPEEMEIVEVMPTERDPFQAAPASAGLQKSAPAAAVGRDPFNVAAASFGTQKSAPFESAGRDPFRLVDNVVFEPEEPVEKEPVEIPPDDEPVVIVPGKVNIQVHTLDLCWLDIFVDNVRVVRTNVPAGRTLSFEAEGEVRLEQVGREKAVTLVVNGENIGRLSAMVPELEQGSVNLAKAGVTVSMERRYPGGVLVGVSFKANAAGN